MKGSTSMRRRMGVAALALIGTFSAVTVPASPAGAFTKPPQAYGGYGSGVETFANVIPTADVARAQVAVARSAVNSQGLTGITDELGNIVSAPDANLASVALGQALDLNLLSTDVELVRPAIAAAPPSSTAVESLLELPVSNLAFADTLEGRASARFNDDGNICIIGADLANGRGQAANVQLLGSGPEDNGLQSPLIELQAETERDVVNTISRQLLTAQVNEAGNVVGQKVGVLSEVTQTVAPVTIADATGNIAISIEVAGVYQLRAFAGGLPGTSFIEYNPQTGGEMPVIRLTIPPSGILGGVLGDLLDVLPDDVASIVNFDSETGQLLIPLGPALDLLAPLVDLLAELGIVIGEQPRAIGSTGPPLENADGTASAGAIDLVRIRPAGAISVLADLVGDVRVGHMEVLAFAPAGGIDCPGLGVNKTTDRDPVQVGESFVYTITITNPFDCVLTNVRVVDDITATNGVTFTVGTTDPQATTVDNIAGGQRVAFADVGPIGPRASRAVQIQLTVNSATGNGRISDTATAVADCATGGGTGTTNVNLTLSGRVTLNAPQVGGSGVSGELPRTGRNDGAFLFVGFSFLVALGGVEVLRRRARSHA